MSIKKKSDRPRNKEQNMEKVSYGDLKSHIMSPGRSEENLASLRNKDQA